jgi:phytoene desaturase
LQKKAIIIGSGFAGLSAASFMAKSGWKVTVLEKHDIPGGRARKLEVSGFTFDRGPSWYWMPDVFERYFHLFGKKVSDYYELKRLDPSYRVYWPDGHWDIPAGRKPLQDFFESIEPGAGEQLSKFLSEAAYKYQVGIHKLVHKPGQSLTEFIDADLIKGLFRLDVFQSMKTHVARFFKDARLRELMEFPVLFLGALPEKTPALYSLMNYADMEGGTWFPAKGMYQIVQGMYDLALELGVEFHFGQEVSAIDVQQGIATAVYTGGKPGESSAIRHTADVIIGGADYHHIETDLLPASYRTYSPDYWDKRVMAPGCLLYYVGLNKKLGPVPHHSLFFDTSFEVHGKEIYTTSEWPSDPLFYLNVTSVTDLSTAPPGGENLFILIPVAAGLTDDTPELREHYFQQVMDRLEKRFGQSIRDAIVVKQSVAPRDFISDYHSFKGNAYGLANTLLQTAVLKPSMRSKKVKNLFFTGQLTVPGPGVPPSLISGEVVAKEVNKLLNG